MGHEGPDARYRRYVLPFFESTHRAFAKIEPDFRADAVAVKEPSGTPPRAKLQAALNSGEAAGVDMGRTLFGRRRRGKRLYKAKAGS